MEEEIANYSSILATRTLNIMKRQKDMTPKEKVGRCPIHYRGRVEANY